MTNLINLITPNNLEEERVKFFGSRSYNPTFHYKWEGQKNFPSFDNPIKQKLWAAIQIQDHPNITYHAAKFFEVDSTDQLTKEATIAARTDGTTFVGSADDYKTLLDAALAEFGLSHYQVMITETAGFNARPQPSKQRILVSRDIHFEFFSMESGIRHEMVHIIRHANGVHNHLSKADNYLPTEEGLASWCQDNTTAVSRGRQQHAIEYIGTTIGVNGSLRDIYNAMRDFGMSESLAWKRASRHKFGFVDTTKPGDIQKPAMYFVNEEKVRGLTTDERLRLFVGKISLADLKDHKQYQGRWTSEELSSYFNL